MVRLLVDRFEFDRIANKRCEARIALDHFCAEPLVPDLLPDASRAARTAAAASCAAALPDAVPAGGVVAVPGPDAVAGAGTGAGDVVGAGVDAAGDVVVVLVAASSRLPQPAMATAISGAISKDLFIPSCSSFDR